MNNNILNDLIVFDNCDIRRVLFNDEYYYSIVDIIRVLTKTPNSNRYWSDLKLKFKKNCENELYDKIVSLNLISKDKKLRKTDCVNEKDVFKLLEFIPSKKIEGFKNHLYEIGLLKINEIGEN